MKTYRNAVAVSMLAVLLASGTTFAQDHHDDRDRHSDRDRDHREHQRYVHHKEWRRGYHMRHQDWDRGVRVDYRVYHLRRPPAGYEWREVDGNYVMAAVATGIIASEVSAASIH